MKNLFLLITLYLLVSCSKTTNVVPEFETASFCGTVECYDEFNKRIDNKGVKVEIEDLPQFSSVTNNSGFFQIKEIPIGTYSFSFFKEGFGKYFLDRYTLIGGIQPVYYYDAKIYKPVDILLLDHTIYYENNSKSVIAKGNVNVSTPYSIYLGYKTSLTDDFVKFFIIYWTETIYQPQSDFFSGGIWYPNFEGNKTLYLALYSTNTYERGYSYYKDGKYYYELGSLVKLTDFEKITIPE